MDWRPAGQWLSDPVKIPDGYCLRLQADNLVRCGNAGPMISKWRTGSVAIRFRFRVLQKSTTSRWVLDDGRDGQNAEGRAL